MSNKIADNPSAKEIKTILPAVRLLGSAAGLASKLGIKRKAMTKFKQQVDELLANAEVLDLPDRFNETFADKGWIATGSLSCDVMREALALHGEGKTDEAEQTVVDWFTEDNIRLFAITRASRFHIARLRDDQLREALSLFLEERYMAAVPLILIACDGFASDVSGVSAFEKDADLTCFDSITGHSTALPALMRMLIGGVRKSTDEEISLPKRHGILHGRSLGYANKTVCAKAWLLMIALVDWAIDKDSEYKRLAEFKRKESETFGDVLRFSRQVQEEKEIIDAFDPWEDVGPFADDLAADSAEFALDGFLAGWKARNFGKMAKHAMNRKGQPVSQLAGEIREMCEMVELTDYEILRVRYSTVARSDAYVRIKAKTHFKDIHGTFHLIVFRYKADGEIAMPADDAVWWVQQNCIYAVMNENFADTE